MKKRVVEAQISAERKAIKELEGLIDCTHPKLREIRRLITESETRIAELLQEMEQLEKDESIENNERYD